MNKNQLKNIFAFIVGCLAFLQFRIMGTFALGEIVALASTPFIAFGKFRENKNARQFVYMAFVWLLGVILADIWNGTPMEDRLKGMFNVVFLISLVPFIYWLFYDNPKRWLIYYMGYSISVLYNYYFQRTYDSDYDRMVWGVYAYYPLAIWGAGWLYYIGRKKLSYILIFLFGLWSLFNMSRNIFLNQSLAIVILIFINIVSKNSDANTFNRLFSRRFIQLSAMLVVGLFLVSYSYESMAQNGTLGEGAKKKYLIQKRSEIGLASGRGDFLVSLYMIQKKPVFGYGSYAKDKDKIAYKYRQARGMNLYHEKYEKTNLIPGHSYILGAWVYAGILGFSFFVFVLIKLWNFFKSGAVLYEPKMAGIIVYVLALYIWNILFSPFSDRINFVVFMMVLFNIYQRHAYRIGLKS